MTPEQETQVETARRVLAAQPTHERTQDEIVWQKWAGVLLAIIDELQRENERLNGRLATVAADEMEADALIGVTVREHWPAIAERLECCCKENCCFNLALKALAPLMQEKALNTCAWCQSTATDLRDPAAHTPDCLGVKQNMFGRLLQECE